jgi:alkylation response protein AidB-like acyl-CoA dehydrogenase
VVVDLSLNDDQLAIQASFAQFFAKECPTERVRAAEPLGFDPALWLQLVETGAVAMSVDGDRGGGGGGIVELALVAEQFGGRVAPVPFVEAAVVARALAATPGAVAAEWLDAVVGEGALVTLALRPAVDGVAELVPAGAVAAAVIALDGDELVVATEPADALSTPPNLGSSPLATRRLRGNGVERRVLAGGSTAAAIFAKAISEWQAATAAAMVGLAAAAVELGVGYVKVRQQFGVPIGSFQSVQHKLADMATAVDGARLLAYKAAWAADAGLEAPPPDALASMAFLFCSKAAQDAALAALHFHGGYGFMLEYDPQLYYRRAKAGALVYGDPRREHRRLADLLFPPGYVPTGAWP